MSEADRSGLPQKVESVLLDAGGVLLDLDYGYLRRLIEARHVGVDESDLARAEAMARNEIDRTMRDGRPVGDAWRDYFYSILGRIGVAAGRHDEIIDILWEAHRRVGLWTVAIPGAPQAVARLKQAGFRVGVVSNAEGQVARDLDNAGFAGLFETVVDSHLVGVRKPDPGIFKIALERMGMPPETAVYLGDVPAVDVRGAQAAGVSPILLDRHDLYPDAGVPRLRSVGELPTLLTETGTGDAGVI